MASINFTGSGKYLGVDIVESTPEHANWLQNNLRQTDLRECLIMGATPWRALHLPLGIKGAVTYTVMDFDGNPAAMFGTVPLEESDESIASVWMLGTYQLEKHFRILIRMTQPILEHFQQRYDILENVVPVDHLRTIRWLIHAGCLFASQPTIVNGYAVVRFVRCADHIEVSFEEDERPVSN